MTSFDKSTSFRSSHEALWDFLQSRLKLRRGEILVNEASDLLIYLEPEMAEIFHLEFLPPHYIRLRYLLSPAVETAKALLEREDLKAALDSLPKEISQSSSLAAERWLQDFDKEARNLGEKPKQKEKIAYAEPEKLKRGEAQYEPFPLAVLFMTGLILSPMMVFFLTAVNWLRLGKAKFALLSLLLAIIFAPLLGMANVAIMSSLFGVRSPYLPAYMGLIFAVIFGLIFWQKKSIEEWKASGFVSKNAVLLNIFIIILSLILSVVLGSLALTVLSYFIVIG